MDAKGETLSTPAFHPKDWYEVSVPTTVVAALVKHKVYPDPFFGTNLRTFPGVTYPIGANFSNIPMQPDSPFIVPWWYRKEFVLPASFKGKTIWLNFGGINYRANIWLNGKLLAKSDDVAGAWRTYEFNITDAALLGKTNVLAVQVFSPTDTDLAITFVDWNPAPPDKNMGLFRDVDITTSGPVALRYPTVVSKVDSPANDEGHLTVTALLKNAANHPVKGTLKGQIEKTEFSQEVELGPGESKDVTFTPEQFPQLNIDHPRLWWPAQMGKPERYSLNLEFNLDGKISDRSETKFGIREVKSEVLSANRRLFSINGKNILIRGGGWSPDMMLRDDPQRLRDEFRYVQDMGLNTIRLEGKLETKEFFDLADERGILLIAGWCCCDHWEHWPNWKPQDFTIAEQSLRDQIYRLRGHPSLMAWMNGSDNPPPPDVEQTYLKVEKDLLWTNPVVSSATAKLAGFSGESGVKMTGPYEYVAPSYWQTDKDRLIPRSSATRAAAAEPMASTPKPAWDQPFRRLKAFAPWSAKTISGPSTIPGIITPAAGRLKIIHVFTDALNARFGPATSADDYAVKAQLQTYEGVRAMYEAYSRNKYTSTGVIQWMLNNAWPSMIWHLYDFYLRPGGGYFGAKRAMESLHPIYGYDDHSIWLVSSQYDGRQGSEANDPGSQPRHERKVFQRSLARCRRRQHKQSPDSA